MRFGRILGLAALGSALSFANTATRAASIPIPGPPGSVTLASLIGNTGTVGNNSFNFLSSVITGTNPTPPTNATIAVSALSVGAGSTIIAPFGFQLSSGFVSTSGTTDDAVTFTATSSGPPISAINLTANAAVTGTGFAEVVESVFVNNSGMQGAFVGQMMVTPTSPTATVTVPLAMQGHGLYILKDIVFNGGTSGTATISIITQTFTETSTPAVPEPTSVVMAGMGFLAALGLSFRRKVRATA
jgi:PEP-CTERM motif